MDRVLKFLFFLMLIVFPFGELGRYVFPQFLTFAPLLLNDVLVGSVILTWGVKKIRERNRIKNHLLVPILLFSSLGLFSLLINSQYLSGSAFLTSFLYLIRWIFYSLLFFVVYDFSKYLRQRIIMTLFIEGMLIVLAGYIQFFFYQNLRNLYYLGWDEHLYRMFSTFLDPNFAGTFFVLQFMFTIFLFYRTVFEKQHIYKIFLGVSGLLTVGAVYLTYSRSALLMLFVSLVTFLLLLKKGKYAVLVLTFIVLGIFFSPKSFQTEGTNIFRIASSEARIESAQKAIAIFQKSPFIGIGFNAYRYAQNRYGYLTDNYWQTTHAGAGTDNSFLFVLATTGIMGFLAYMYLWISFIKSLLNNRGEKESVFPYMIFSCIIGLFINALFINSLFYIFIMEWLWIMLGAKEYT